jgi:hypothetical protein
MAEVIPIALPYLSFNFTEEAKTAAVNEACAGGNVACVRENLCPECQALAIAIEDRLKRAFAAGAASMVLRED